jgi:hypothetical protein
MAGEGSAGGGDVIVLICDTGLRPVIKNRIPKTASFHFHHPGMGGRPMSLNKAI